MLRWVHYLGLPGILLGLPLTVTAQTNSPPPAADLFVLAAPHLRSEPVDPPKSQPPPRRIISGETSPTSVAPAAPNRLPGPFSASTGRADTDFYLRHQDFGLIPPLKPSRDPLARSFDSIFRPEEFRIGQRATFSCTIATAIKRKNPLCLLNPLFLNLSW